MADSVQDFWAKFQTLTNPYDRRARLWPALLFMTPVTIWVFFFLGGFDKVQSYVWGALTVFGGTALLIGIARNAGKTVEKRLLKKWGGWPTTLILRHGDDTLPDATKARYHRYFSSRINDVAPTPHDERADPRKADQFYWAGCEHLKTKTRDRAKYGLLFDENCNYGFWRNLRGLKTSGLGLAAIALAYWIYRSGAVTWERPFISWSVIVNLPNDIALPLVLTLAVITIWLVFVNDRAVENHAYAYARQLVEASDRLESEGI